MDKKIYCEDCSHWQRVRADAGVSVGECHCSPPGSVTRGMGKPVGVWPVTAGDDWCAKALPRR